MDNLTANRSSHDLSDTPWLDQTSAAALSDDIGAAFGHIAPFWPLQNLVAVNPLQGLESMPIEQALRHADALFRAPSLPAPMARINRITIKWCQAFFDDGQATIAMPGRQQGLFPACHALFRFDRELHQGDAAKLRWLSDLPCDPEQAIRFALDELAIEDTRRTAFLTLMLTTLPGWAAMIRQRTDWPAAGAAHPRPVTQADYLALRLVIACLVWRDAAALLEWHESQLTNNDEQPLAQWQAAEDRYRQALIERLRERQNTPVNDTRADAQLVFCIDVRSEPFRRALERNGNYQTLGFAGFFGIPVRIADATTGDRYSACPVLLQPAHTVTEHGCSDTTARQSWLRRLYQSVKYSFAAPFALVELLGPASGAWMALRSFAPALAARLHGAPASGCDPHTDLSDIDGDSQLGYAEGALRMMGLTRNFAPLVVLCGHGSTTTNNAYATALDCGACGGRHGAPNARILSAILNDADVRQRLAARDIVIPADTRFIAAEHDTTTDAVALFGTAALDAAAQRRLDALQRDLALARASNNRWRAGTLDRDTDMANAGRETLRRSLDWSEVRPEWGLARNAAFIVAPRTLTRDIDLEGRAFLHSYDWQQDADGASLSVILTAPMVVAQWINSQYLFSTVDNVAYGAGSKITKNITGKTGIMQGNASDLMQGLPLQSVFASDREAYHEPMRLTTIVHAPRSLLDSVISQQPVLQTLFSNGWVRLLQIDPHNGEAWALQRTLDWTRAD